MPSLSHFIDWTRPRQVDHRMIRPSVGEGMTPGVVLGELCVQNLGRPRFSAGDLLTVCDN
jgi:hypothetical protein